MSSPPLPSLQALRILDAAARLKSFSAAAVELGLTHSAVSHQIRQLERRLGARLFERRGRGMEPRESALALVARSRQALHILAEAFGDPVRPLQTGLRISTTGSFARSWLLPRMDVLVTAGAPPLLEIETSTGLADLRRGGLDAAVRYGAGGWPGLKSVRLGGERAFPVAGAELARRYAGCPPAALARAPLISNRFVSWRTWLEAAGAGEAPQGPYVLEVNDNGLALAAAAAGRGLALARARLARSAIETGAVQRLSEIAVDDGYAYHLVWPADSRHGAAISALAEALKAEFDLESAALGLPA